MYNPPNDTDMDIVNLISTTCSCDKQTAQEYLEGGIVIFRNCRNLATSREDDLYMACSTLGIEDDYVEYFPSTAWHGLTPKKFNDMTYFQNINSLADLKSQYRPRYHHVRPETKEGRNCLYHACAQYTRV